jgi:hypothetical protein
MPWTTLYCLPRYSMGSFAFRWRGDARGIRIRPGVSQPQYMRPLPAAIVPSLAAGLAKERGLKLPDRRLWRPLTSGRRRIDNGL